MSVTSLLVPAWVQLAELPSLALTAERAGFFSIWYPDSRFARDPFVGMTVIAQATKRVSIGLAVTDPFMRHPALIAMGATSVSEVAGRATRIALGMGASGSSQIDLPVQRRVSALKEAACLIRTIGHGKTWSKVDGAFPGRDLHLECPARTPEVWFATRSPRVLRASFESADGAIVGHLWHKEHLDRLMAAASGKRGTARMQGIAVRIQAVVGGSAGERRERAKRVAAWVLRQHSENFSWLEELGLSLPAECVSSLRSVKSPRDIGDAWKTVPDVAADAFAVQATNAEEFWEQVSPIRSVVDEVIVRPDVIDRSWDLVWEIAAGQ